MGIPLRLCNAAKQQCTDMSSLGGCACYRVAWLTATSKWRKDRKRRMKIGRRPRPDQRRQRPKLNLHTTHGEGRLDLRCAATLEMRLHGCSGTALLCYGASPFAIGSAVLAATLFRQQRSQWLLLCSPLLLLSAGQQAVQLLASTQAQAQADKQTDRQPCGDQHNKRAETKKKKKSGAEQTGTPERQPIPPITVHGLLK